MISVRIIFWYLFSTAGSESWKSPVNSFQNNVNIFIDLLEDIRRIDSIAGSISLVGSSG
ncbi:MAG: hypothetical protein R3A12_03860 [Ignavibacteria bacterium]